MAQRVNKSDEFCNCEQYCLKSKCESSSSGMMVKKCWCADCNEIRKEVKKQSRQVIVVKKGQ